MFEFRISVISRERGADLVKFDPKARDTEREGLFTGWLNLELKIEVTRADIKLSTWCLT